MLAMLHREVLTHPEDTRLRTLFSEVQAFPDMPLGFRDPDLGIPSEPTFTLRLERDGLALGFLTTLTAFTAPQNVTLEELRIESFFPLDEATAAACTAFAHGDTP